MPKRNVGPEHTPALAGFQPSTAGLESFEQSAREETAKRVDYGRAWAKPTQITVTPSNQPAGVGNAGAYTDPGVVMNAPSHAGEFQAFKEQVIANQPGKQWFGTDADVAYQKEMYDRKKGYDAQKWMLSLTDPRLPWGSQFLSRIAPEILEQRAATITAEAQKKARMEWIAAYGIRNREDADFLRMIDMKIVDATAARNGGYSSGWFLTSEQRRAVPNDMTLAHYTTPYADTGAFTASTALTGAQFNAAGNSGAF